MITTALAYLLIVCYFIVERLLRKGEKALSLQAGEADRGSSEVIWVSVLFSILLVLLAPVLNAHQIGHWKTPYVGWAGVLLMLAGLTLRYWAAKTLGEFYTRTLQTVEGKQIVDQAPYSKIRHPGYLGTFLMEIGAGLAIANWLVLTILVVVGLSSRVYRIRTEEEMLVAKFGGQYQAYSENTWRLIPFVY
jgi:protein-S-isoprenylcysteine O-methyltransferase Ste14